MWFMAFEIANNHYLAKIQGDLLKETGELVPAKALEKESMISLSLDYRRRKEGKKNRGITSTKWDV